MKCRLDLKEEISLFIDLGTNGEMALGNREGIVVSSAAAGPAFEGGNISCGTGSIPGAISHVTIKDRKAFIQTIQEKAAIGICGTGVIEIVSELLKENLIDKTGLYREEYQERGYLLAVTENNREIRFTQKDIREVQLAKAAICAGIEIMMQRYQVAVEDIKKVYLAGGFGNQINQEKDRKSVV